MAAATEMSDLVLDVLRGLIRIPSVNPSIAPDEGQDEEAIAAFARDWLNAHGAKARLEHAAPGRPNVVAEVGDDGPTLVLCAHLDTVGTTGMTIPPFEPRVEGSRVYGRGAYDMKGSVAAIMSAMATLASSGGASGRVVAALVADEEYASLGAYDFVRRHTADACIVTEPSEGQLILAHKGFVWADVTTTGRAAHGSRWDLGVSAIGKMGAVITALEDLDRTTLRNRVAPLVGPASMHCAMIDGGTGLSTYADRCRLRVERRTVPGESIDDVTRELEQVVRGACDDATVDVFFHRPPLTCDPGAPIVECVRAAAARVTGAVPPDAGVAYWMDAAVFGGAGIATVNYGPSGAGAHEAVEWVDLDSVRRVSDVLVEAATSFAALDRPV